MTEAEMETIKTSLARIEQKQDKTLEKVEAMTERIVRLEERVTPETIGDIRDEITALKIANTELKTRIVPIQAGVAVTISVILSWVLDGFRRGWN